MGAEAPTPAPMSPEMPAPERHSVEHTDAQTNNIGAKLFERADNSKVPGKDMFENGDRDWERDEGGLVKNETNFGNSLLFTEPKENGDILRYSVLRPHYSGRMEAIKTKNNPNTEPKYLQVEEGLGRYSSGSNPVEADYIKLSPAQSRSAAANVLGKLRSEVAKHAISKKEAEQKEVNDFISEK